MVAKKKQNQVNITNPIFYNLDVNMYKNSRMNLLSAKTNLLVSRNYAVRFLDYYQKEENIKNEIKKTLNRMTLILKKMKSELPTVSPPKNQNLKKKSTPRAITVSNDNSDIRNEIDYELDSINQKLKELAGL